MTRYYDLDTIKSDFHVKTYIMLLRRTTSGHQENQRRLLLISYFQDLPRIDYKTTNLPALSQGESSSASSTKDMVVDISHSPLKCQLSLITINADNPTKKQIIYYDFEKEAMGDEDTNSSASPANKESVLPVSNKDSDIIASRNASVLPVSNKDSDIIASRNADTDEQTRNGHLALFPTIKLLKTFT